MSEVAVSDTFFSSAAKLGSADRTRVFDFLAKFQNVLSRAKDNRTFVDIWHRETRG